MNKEKAGHKLGKMFFLITDYWGIGGRSTPIPF